MAKDVEQRYQTAIELAEDAKAALVSTGMVAAPSPSPSSQAPVTSQPVPNSPPPGSAPHPQPEHHQPAQSRRLILAVVGASVVALAAVAALVIALVAQSHTSAKNSAGSRATTRVRPPRSTDSTVPSVPPMAAFASSPDLGANCQYPPSQDPASRPVNPPPSGKVSTSPAQISATISTNLGDIGIQLANSESPCTVNSFLSLVQQQFFNNTPCTRLGNQPTFGLLQCGATENDGSGGPGYDVPDEYPTNQYPAGDPAITRGVVYPRGTLATAPGPTPNTNSSVFNMVYRDSDLQANSTVFGTIDQAGLETLDKIAQEVGVSGGGDDGAPAKAVTITSVRLG